MNGRMAVFDWPDAPNVDDEVTGPDGQTYKWDGTKWIAIRYMVAEIDGGDF